MKVQQISVFLENKPGHLSSVCKALADADINILTLTLADAQQFGILRLIVKDWERATSVLEAAGFTVKTTEMVACEVPDQPGGLETILQKIDPAQVNIDYMYAFTARRDGKAIMVFRFTDPDAAVNALRDAGLNIVSSVELYDCNG